MQKKKKKKKTEKAAILSSQNDFFFRQPIPATCTRDDRTHCLQGSLQIWKYKRARTLIARHNNSAFLAYLTVCWVLYDDSKIKALLNELE